MIGQSKGPRVCIVCDKTNASYRCPKCRANYCSKDCCKTHQESSCLKVGEDVSLTNGSKIDSVIANAETSVVKQAPREDFVTMLTSEQKSRLRKDRRIQDLLGSKRLRAHLDMVDTAHDRSAALKKLRMTNPDFSAFIDLVSDVVTGS